MEEENTVPLMELVLDSPPPLHSTLLGPALLACLSRRPSSLCLTSCYGPFSGLSRTGFFCLRRSLLLCLDPSERPPPCLSPVPLGLSLPLSLRGSDAKWADPLPRFTSLLGKPSGLRFCSSPPTASYSPWPTGPDSPKLWSGTVPPCPLKAV